MDNRKCTVCGYYATLRDYDYSLDIIFPKIHKPIIGENDIDSEGDEKLVGTKDSIGIQTLSYVCPNPDCGKLGLQVSTYTSFVDSFGNRKIHEKLKSWSLLPNSNNNYLHDSVPKPIRDDFSEAYLILDLSPKASATLARRCLQGMIRDFFEMKDKKTLYQEIDAIRDEVSERTRNQIDAVRHIGNVGAHMEYDVNTIIDIDQGESEMLLQLIESLSELWYVAAYEDEIRAKALVDKVEAIRKKKKENE